MTRLKYLENLDLTEVPDAVLRAIRTAVDIELTARADMNEAHCRSAGDFMSRRKVLVLPSEDRSFAALDAQPWDHLFPEGDPTPKFYVYAHMMTGARTKLFEGCDVPFGLSRLPFYIGKGTGERAFDFNRNQGHRALLLEQQRHMRPNRPLVKILRDGLTEQQAYALESKLIYFFGTRYEVGRNGVLVNLDIPRRPAWCGKAASRKLALEKSLTVISQTR